MLQLIALYWLHMTATRPATYQTEPQISGSSRNTYLFRQTVPNLRTRLFLFSKGPDTQFNASVSIAKAHGKLQTYLPKGMLLGMRVI